MVQCIYYLTKIYLQMLYELSVQTNNSFDENIFVNKHWIKNFVTIIVAI